MADESSSAIAGILTATPPPAALEWAVRSLGQAARLVSVEPLGGGSSHANHVVRVEDATRTTRDFVLRRWVRPGWQATDPGFSPEQEAGTLRLARSGGVPVPELVACDPTAVTCDVPALLVTRMPGVRPRRPREMASFVRQLAAALATIHAVDPVAAQATVPAYRRYHDDRQSRATAFAAKPWLWERAIEMAGGVPTVPRSCFIHRDYHQGNTLWLRGRLTAIVDWTTASFGSPLVDVAHMRANLAISFGIATADAFLDDCRQVEPATPWDPTWDLRVAVDFIPDLSRMDLSVRAARRLDAFVERAIAALGGSIERPRGRGATTRWEARS